MISSGWPEADSDGGIRKFRFRLTGAFDLLSAQNWVGLRWTLLVILLPNKTGDRRDGNATADAGTSGRSDGFIFERITQA